MSVLPFACIEGQFLTGVLFGFDFDRTTNGTGIASTYNYSQIKKLDAGKFFYKKNTKIYPPTLKEVLSLCQKPSSQLPKENNRPQITTDSNNRIYFKFKFSRQFNFYFNIRK